MSEAPALTTAGVFKTFGSTRALRGASLTLEPSRVRALLGENGSGKSTLAKIIAGVHRADSGVIRRGDVEVAINNPLAARRLGIAMVFQELTLAPDLDPVDNIFLGRERRGSVPGMLDRRSEERACAAILTQLDLAVDLRRPVQTLGAAQKQMLEIGKALCQKPAVLILDEPTACITRHEIDRLFTVIKHLRDGGAAILYVTHHLREVLQIADDVSVMRSGRIISDLPITPETTEAELLEALTGKAAGPRSTTPTPSSGTPVLQVSDLRTSGNRGVSFHVSDGEIVGIYGVVGCGREDISRALVGLRPMLGGNVKLYGKAFRASDPARALAAGVGFLPSDRKQEGILPQRSVRENLMLASLPSAARSGFIRRGSERAAALAQLGVLGVKCSSPEQAITALSGGNQQKVLLGRVLAARPRLLLLEDPTAGIDVDAKQDLYRLLRECRASGMSFLWVSSDLVETLTMCDRVYAMYDGAIVSEIASPTLADEEHLLTMVLGRTMECHA